MESSQIRTGRVVPTNSHRKRLVKQGQFRAPHSTRRRTVQSTEQPRDKVMPDVAVVDGVVDLVVEEVDSVVEEVADPVVVVEEAGLEEVVWMV